MSELEFDRTELARVFACPDRSRMRWERMGPAMFQCRGCPGNCGTSRGELFKTVKRDVQAELILTAK